MKKNYSLFPFFLLFTLFTNAQEYVTPDVNATYRIQQKEGQVFTILPENEYPTIINHWGNGENAAEDQYFKFVAVVGEENTYNIESISTGKFVAVMSKENNTWDGELVTDKTLATAKFKLEVADPSHVYFMNISNSKYMAPDDLGPAQQVYFDKNKSEKAYWALRQVETASINDAHSESLNIVVKDGFITIEGVDSFGLYSITGVEKNINSRLQAGVYIVIVAGNSYKVFIR